MSLRIAVVLAAIVLIPGSNLPAQSIPVLSRSLPAGSLVSLGTGVSVDLTNYFAIPDVSGPVVQFDTVLGKFNVELLDDVAPQHAANFLNYVNAGAYTNTFFHRSVSFDNGAKSILQGGGYTWVGTAYDTIFRFNPVPLEYNAPNARGTLAAARTSNINSATSEWYFNLRDNSTILGPSNGGGYTVFGRVIGTGMTVVDAFGALNDYSAPPQFPNLPLRSYSGSGSVTTANIALINSIAPVSVYPTGQGTSVITFSGTNSSPTTVNATISGSTLTLTPLAAGSTTVTIRATDTNGNQVSGSMTITVPQPLTRAVAVNETAVFNANSGASSYQ